MSTEADDIRAVPVFKTEDPAIVPLATMALEAEGIAYVIRHAGKVDSLGWTMSQAPTNRPVVMEIVVGSDVAAKARELLADLQQSSGAPLPADPSPAEPIAVSEPPTIALEDAASGIKIGDITESQLQELTSRLQEESSQQYFITGGTVEMLQQAGVDPALVAMLRDAVGTDESGRVIRWAVR
jgi:hypothetical protein